MNFQSMNASASPEVSQNENWETIDFASVYGKRQPVTTGLTWGYYGGRWAGILIADGTLALTNTATNYVVVLRSTGVISVSTSATNWNNTTAYVRVYKLTTAGGVVTATEDHRAGPSGISWGSTLRAVGETPAGTMNDVNATFTLASAPTAGTLALFHNGQRLSNTVGYTLSGLTITMIAPHIPSSGDTLIADYDY